MRTQQQLAVLQKLRNFGLEVVAQEADTKWSFGAPYVADNRCSMDLQLEIDSVNKGVLEEYRISQKIQPDRQLALVGLNFS